MIFRSAFSFFSPISALSSFRPHSYKVCRGARVIFGDIFSAQRSSFIMAQIPNAPLTSEQISAYRNDFYADPKNVVCQNVCTRFDPREVCINRKRSQKVSHFYNIKVPSEGKPVTQQDSTGRCWLFAALNVMRLPFMKKHNIEEFEFSQGYLFFWDKIERAHYWLLNMANVARSGEGLDGRLTTFLLQDPIQDGGQWDMIVNLVNKYGVVPKRCFPESFSCKSSGRMNAILKTKLREFAKVIREQVSAGADDSEVLNTIHGQMKVVFNIVATCLGAPLEEFTFEYYDKDKEYHKIGPISPLDFYRQHVKPLFDVNDKVCLVNDPRPTQSYGQLYTLQCLGNVVGGRPVAYNNQPIATLIQAVKASISDGEAVWFGCEVGKMYEGKGGIEDLDALDYKLVFNTDVEVGLDKADRMLYGDSCMTHAMVFTAVGTDESGEVSKLRVENSWGEEQGHKGYLLMTAEWFNEFVFEVVVDKKHITQKVLDVFSQEAVVLPAWDPMGTLARAH